MLFPMTIIYEAMPPTCLGAKASQATIIMTIESADRILGKNLLYTAIVLSDYSFTSKGPAVHLDFCRSLTFMKRIPDVVYSVAITRSSSAAATVACGAVVLQVQFKPTFVQ